MNGDITLEALCHCHRAPLYLTELYRPISSDAAWASSSSFCIHSSSDSSTYENKLLRPQLLCSRSLCVDQSAERLAVIGHVVRNL